MQQVHSRFRGVITHTALLRISSALQLSTRLSLATGQVLSNRHTGTTKEVLSSAMLASRVRLLGARSKIGGRVCFFFGRQVPNPCDIRFSFLDRQFRSAIWVVIIPSSFIGISRPSVPIFFRARLNCDHAPWGQSATAARSKAITAAKETKETFVHFAAEPEGALLTAKLLLASKREKFHGRVHCTSKDLARMPLVALLVHSGDRRAPGVPRHRLAMVSAKASTRRQSVNSYTPVGSVGPPVISMIRRIMKRSRDW